MKICTLIVDRERSARRGIERLLSEIDGFDIAASCSNGEEMLQAIDEHDPDLVFLDIRLPELDAFEALSLVPADRLPRVVFVTADEGFAVRAFEAHAIDFVLKPYSRERFFTACARAKAALARRDGERAGQGRTLEDLSGRGGSGEPAVPAAPPGPFVIRSHGRVNFVPEADVLWVEASGDYVRLHTKDHSFLLRDTMTNIESRLGAEKFVRIHRSTIVRLDVIREIRLKDEGHRGEVILPDGSATALSRSGKKRLEEALGGQI